MSAPALVLIPGLMCDQSVWQAQCAELRGRGIECRIAEHGLADSLQAMAAAVLAAHPGPLAVAGHSMGGRVALELARVAGARLRGVALLDTGYRPLAPGEEGEREVRARMALLEQARAQGVRAMAATWVQGMVHPDRLQDHALIDAILNMFERRSVAHFAAQIRALIGRPDAGPLLPTIHCPTLLLCGEQDRWSTPAQHRAMAQLIPGAALTCVPECGHMAPLEQPVAVNAALRSWFARVETFNS
ncbi:MAG TPA: alpha/beta hydrolase [Steroidobacteraceae bacterium]